MIGAENSDWLEDLLSRIGQPIGCGLCKVAFLPGELHEVTVPSAVLDFDGLGLFFLHEVVWVCGSCHRSP